MEKNESDIKNAAKNKAAEFSKTFNVLFGVKRD